MRVLRAVLNDLLHVAALRPNESARHLELLVVGDLDVKSARILDCLVVYVRAEVLVGILVAGLRGWHREWLAFNRDSVHKHIFVVEHRLFFCIRNFSFYFLCRLAVKWRVFLCFF